MVRNGMILLGVGMLVLWLVGLYHHATPWLTWADGLGALFAFVAAGSISAAISRNAMVAAPSAIAAGLFLVWIAALTTVASRWLAWWTFAFACGFLVVGLASGSRPALPRTTTGPRAT
jgi:hypothetical protein